MPLGDVRLQHALVALLDKIGEQIETGAHVELYWQNGPQTGLRPFVRWEGGEDPLRVHLEQQVYYLTDRHFGVRSIAELDRSLGESSFLRLLATVEANQEITEELAGTGWNTGSILPASAKTIRVEMTPDFGLGGAAVNEMGVRGARGDFAGVASRFKLLNGLDLQLVMQQLDPFGAQPGNIEHGDHAGGDQAGRLTHSLNRVA